jgi:hypothetical protein
MRTQAGFRTDRCPDAVGPLKAALQTLTESGQDTYVLFIDLVKAFDSINREMLWQILEKSGDVLGYIRRISDWQSQRLFRIYIRSKAR